jgi:hypothetical protein
LKVFSFSGFTLVSQNKTRSREKIFANKIERSVHEKVLFGAGIGRLVSRLQIIGDFAG